MTYKSGHHPCEHPRRILEDRRAGPCIGRSCPRTENPEISLTTGESEYEGTHPSSLLKQPNRSLTAEEGSHSGFPSGSAEWKWTDWTPWDSKLLEDPRISGDNKNWRQTRFGTSFIWTIASFEIKSRISSWIRRTTCGSCGVTVAFRKTPGKWFWTEIWKPFRTTERTKASDVTACHMPTKREMRPPHRRIAAHPILSHIVTYDWPLRQRTRREYPDRRPLLCRVRDGGNLDRVHERAELGRGRRKKWPVEKRCPEKRIWSEASLFCRPLL